MFAVRSTPRNSKIVQVQGLLHLSCYRDKSRTPMIVEKDLHSGHVNMKIPK